LIHFYKRVTCLAMPPRIKRPRGSYLNWEAGLAIGVGIVAGAYIWPPIFRQVTGLDKLYEKQEVEKKEKEEKK